METARLLRILFLLCGSTIVLSAEGSKWVFLPPQAQGLECGQDLSCPVGKICVTGICCKTCVYFNRQNGTLSSEKMCVQSAIKDCGDCLTGYRVADIVGINEDSSLRFSDMCQLYSLNAANNILESIAQTTTQSPDISESTGMIIGGVVLTVAILMAVSALIYLFFGKKMRKKKEPESRSPQPDNGELHELNPQPIEIDARIATTPVVAVQNINETD